MKTWEDVKGYQDVRDGHVPCIRRGRKETCLCSNERCNSARGVRAGGLVVLVAVVAGLLR